MPTGAAIGRQLRIRDQSFEVIGVLEAEGGGVRGQPG